MSNIVIGDPKFSMTDIYSRKSINEDELSTYKIENKFSL